MRRVPAWRAIAVMATMLLGACAAERVVRSANGTVVRVVVDMQIGDRALPHRDLAIALRLYDFNNSEGVSYVVQPWYATLPNASAWDERPFSLSALDNGQLDIAALDTFQVSPPPRAHTRTAIAHDFRLA